MSIDNQAPLWLEIKTEYIDANLDNVIAYLGREVNNKRHDAFYNETVSLLLRRVDEITAELAGSNIWESDEAGDKENCFTALRMIGAAMLIEGSIAAQDKGHFFFFIKSLSAIVPGQFTEDLTELAVRSLAYDISAIGYSWHDLGQLLPELLAHKLLQAVKFGQDARTEAWFQNKGSICLKDGVIRIFATNKDGTSFSKTTGSLQLLDDVISVQTTARDKIQQKDEDNVDIMDKFTTGFIREAVKSRPSQLRQLKKYAVDDVVPVRFLGKDFLGNLLVETVEEDHEKIEGQLPFKGIAYRQYYTNATLGEYLQEGDVFDAVYKGGERNTFDVQKTFADALLNKTIETNVEIIAVLKQVSNKKQMTWFTEAGYPAYVEAEDNPGTYNIGDNAKLLITGCQGNGYVYAQIIGDLGDEEEPVNEDDARRYCIEGMLYEENDFLEKKPTILRELDKITVKGLTHLLFDWQKSVGQAQERFRILCVCRILTAMTDDAQDSEYIELACTYLKNLVAFATGRMDDIKPIEPRGEFSVVKPLILRGKITQLLQAYGGDEDSQMLSDIIHDTEAEPLLVQLAKLIQSCNRIDDVYPAIKTVIKREITKFLAVETEDNADFDQAVGPNLGVENSRQEFKTSFFFAHPKAYEQNQEKNIFRSLCSFLNTQDGGTLYLGVNDSGGINGLKTDLEHLERKIIGNYKGIDGYIRYITDRAKEWFDLDVRVHFKIEPMYDGSVVAINVEPYQYGVVEFDGVAYIRNNSESVKMSQTLRRQIEARRLASGQERSKNLVAIAEAIREQRQITVFGYASGSSSAKEDSKVAPVERHLEPFALAGNNAYMWAYDKDDGCNKIFRISRIGNIRIGDAWSSKNLHKKGQMDVFHCTGVKQMEVKLELDMLAHNLLIEEYQDAESEVVKDSNGKWILDTMVWDIHGVGRFYCGLADHITILEGSELIEYAKDFFNSGLKRL